jgi:hypothetical protein
MSRVRRRYDGSKGPQLLILSLDRVQIFTRVFKNCFPLNNYGITLDFKILTLEP